MPPKVIDLHSAEDRRDVVHLAVQALAEGKLVVFPTETVYGLGASALDEEAVGRLLEVKGRAAGHPLALAIKSADEALDYAPEMGSVGRRLARRCWPGPVTLVIDGHHPDSLIRQLPPGARQAVCPNGTIGLRVPAHPMVLDVMRMLAGPVALTSANRTGGADPVTAHEAVEALGEDVQLVLDDGRCRYGQPSTVVKLLDDELEVLREGVVSEHTLKRLASYVIVFVCTGNTCRSPMAEAICRRLVAERLGCREDDLADRGVVIESAGIAAMPGGRASPEALDVLAEMGIDLSLHQSQPVTEPLIQQADAIFAMTRSHRDAILGQWPGTADRLHLLRDDGGDISDPIGGPPEVYGQCAAQIKAELEKWLPRLEAEGLFSMASPGGSEGRRETGT